MADYIRPVGQIIEWNEKTERLYLLEYDRNMAITTTARERAKVLGHDRSEFWTRTIPEEILSILESAEKSFAHNITDLTSVALAIEVYLERRKARLQDE